jgi:FixJ family two-component response regulator
MSKDIILVAIVDDEESVRRALERLLRSAGLNVVTFADGREFLLSLASHSPDCLVLDLHMPGFSGFDVMDAVPDSLPVIAITGQDSRATQARAGRAQAYLRKPVNDEALLEAIVSAVFLKQVPKY